MTGLVTRTCRKLTQTISRRLPERYRRDDSGLTTLEWLLIVAAVAGLAALAVVLVQNVVSDTSEQIAGSSARRTAAEFAAAEIVADALRAPANQPRGLDSWGEWTTEYTRKCNQLSINYSDINPALNIMPTFSVGATLAGQAFAPQNASTQPNVRNAAPAGSLTTAVAHCQVT